MFPWKDRIFIFTLFSLNQSSESLFFTKQLLVYSQWAVIILLAEQGFIVKMGCMNNSNFLEQINDILFFRHKKNLSSQ